MENCRNSSRSVLLYTNLFVSYHFKVTRKDTPAINYINKKFNPKSPVSQHQHFRKCIKRNKSLLSCIFGCGKERNLVGTNVD